MLIALTVFVKPFHVDQVFPCSWSELHASPITFHYQAKAEKVQRNDFMSSWSHEANVFVFIWFHKSHCNLLQPAAISFSRRRTCYSLSWPSRLLPFLLLLPDALFFLLHLQAPSSVPRWADQKMPACTQRCTSSSPPCALTLVWTLLTAPRRPQRRREAKCQSCGEWKVTSLAFFHYFSARLLVVSLMAWTCTSWFYPQRDFFSPLVMFKYNMFSVDHCIKVASWYSNELNLNSKLNITLISYYYTMCAKVNVCCQTVVVNHW